MFFDLVRKKTAASVGPGVDAGAGDGEGPFAFAASETADRVYRSLRRQAGGAALPPASLRLTVYAIGV